MAFCRDDGYAAGHCLQHCDAERFIPGGQHEQVALEQEAAYVVLPAGKTDLVAQVQCRSEVHEPAPLGAVPREIQAHILTRQPAETAQQQVKAFFMHEPAVRHYFPYFRLAVDSGDRGETGEIGNQPDLPGANALVHQVIPLRPGGRGKNGCVPEIFQVHEIMGVGNQRDVELARCRTCQVGRASQ